MKNKKCRLLTRTTFWKVTDWGIFDSINKAKIEGQFMVKEGFAAGYHIEIL